MHDLFANRHSKLLLGVVHLPPLPGSPGAPPPADRPLADYLDECRARAEVDAARILAAGFDGYVIENFGDVPFYAEAVPPHVTAIMTSIAMMLPREDAVGGVNVLRNDARAGVAIAAAAGLDFVRVNVHTGAAVTDQGIVEGRAAETIRERASLAPQVAIFADVDVKHATPLGLRFDIVEAARDTAYRGLADALIVTGAATGSAAAINDLQNVKRATPDVPLLVGSGVDEDTVGEVLAVADGAIVGTALKEDGRVDRPVDLDRARHFVERARS